MRLLFGISMFLVLRLRLLWMCLMVVLGIVSCVMVKLLLWLVKVVLFVRCVLVCWVGCYGLLVVLIYRCCFFMWMMLMCIVCGFVWLVYVLFGSLLIMIMVLSIGVIVVMFVLIWMVICGGLVNVLGIYLFDFC